MTVWQFDKNAAARTMVITAEFKASISNVWQLWADPRLLERWWGPPGFPATFEHHDLTPGGTITYSMSGTDSGDRFDGTWNVVEVDPPTRLVVEDAPPRTARSPIAPDPSPYKASQLPTCATRIGISWSGVPTRRNELSDSNPHKALSCPACDHGTALRGFRTGRTRSKPRDVRLL